MDRRTDFLCDFFNMTTVGERIKSKRLALGLSQSALAALCGWPDYHTRIAKYEKNQRKLSNHTAEILSKALKTTPEWLMFGREPFDTKSHDVISAVGQPVGVHPILGYLPVLEWDEVPNWLNIAYDPIEREKFMKNKQKIHHAITDIGENAFALRIKNDSMTSRSGGISLAEGEFVFIDPGKKVENGKLVIFSVPGSKETTLRRYTEDGGKKYLIPLNPQYPSIEMTEETKVLGIAIGKYVEFSGFQ